MVEHTTALHDAHTRQPDLKGRCAVITGGTTGIGRAIAILLASYGVKVFVCGRTAEHLADGLGGIRKVGEGDGIAVDLTRPEELKQFFAAADSYLGGIDIAVINATVPAESISETSEPDARYQIEADFTAYLICAQQAAKRMQAGGDIVFIGSMSAVSRDGGNSIYVAAKRGVEGFVTALRKELAEQGIKVGLIEPGFTGADFQYPEFSLEKQRDLIHAEQMLRAEEYRRSHSFHVNAAASRRSFPDAGRAPFAALMIGDSDLCRACRGLWAGGI